MSSRRVAQTQSMNIKNQSGIKDMLQNRKVVPAKPASSTKSSIRAPTLPKNLSKPVASPRTAAAMPVRVEITSRESKQAQNQLNKGKSKACKAAEAEEMIKSTGTDSSGVFSEAEMPSTAASRSCVHKPTTRKQQVEQPRIKPPSLRSPMPVSQKSMKPPLKEDAKSPSLAEQFLRAEFKNETAALKAKHRDDLQQQRHDLEEKHRREVAMLLAEKEAFLQNQMEQKEQQLRLELLEVLDKQRMEFLRVKEEREIQFDAKLSEVEQLWKQRLDELHKQLAAAISEKQTLEKSIHEEVETRVQATQQRLIDLGKETCSLQAVLELRTAEARALRKDLEKLAAAAAECATLRERNQTLLNTVEGLQAQLEQKTSEERRLQGELSALSNQCREESQRSRRLSMEKEQLQWKLSLQADKSASFERTSGSKSLPYGDVGPGTPKIARRPLPLLKLSPIVGDGQSNNNNNNNNHCGSVGQKLDVVTSSTPRDSLHPPASTMDSPSSPTVRDFMEKSASVAYVLDLGENSLEPPAPASPWQRRRGLFRFSSLRWTRSTTR